MRSALVDVIGSRSDHEEESGRGSKERQRADTEALKLLAPLIDRMEVEPDMQLAVIHPMLHAQLVACVEDRTVLYVIGCVRLLEAQPLM